MQEALWTLKGNSCRRRYGHSKVTDAGGAVDTQKVTDAGGAVDTQR